MVTGIVGCAGLLPTVAAIKAKKDICLANKETLIAGGWDFGANKESTHCGWVGLWGKLGEHSLSVGGTGYRWGTEGMASKGKRITGERVSGEVGWVKGWGTGAKQMPSVDLQTVSRPSDLHGPPRVQRAHDARIEMPAVRGRTSPAPGGASTNARMLQRTELR